MKKYLFLSIILNACFISICAAQTASDIVLMNSNPSLQSPNVSALGNFGDIPVSPYTGAANISIPIGEITNGTIKVPISLSYYTQGCRPDEHPSWVGLNWSLSAGGVITRHTNGYFDEQERRSGERTSYVDEFSTLAASNWNQQGYLDQIGGGANEYRRDYAPDEFSFSFNGISGSFLLNHEGKWVVISKDNLTLKVEHEISTSYQMSTPTAETYQVPRAITKFVITANDGTVYVFGKDQNAIEFSCVAVPTDVASYNIDPQSSPVPPPNKVQLGSIKGNIQASAWLLSEVISPAGRHVKFYYDRKYTIKQTVYTDIKFTEPAIWRFNKYDVNQVDQYLVNSSYLDRIETDNGTICTFLKSISNELAYPERVKPLTGDTFFPYLFPSLTKTFYKLDKLEITTNGTLIKQVGLNYIENNQQRLMLEAVKFKSVPNTNGEYKYAFEYNQTPLPPYNSGQEDHWGFYNGKNLWDGASSQNQTTIPNVNNYYASREPDSILMKAGVLSKMTYPSGGYSLFFFEPHTYSTIVNQTPSMNLQLLTNNKMAGGLRIRRIENYDAISTTPIIKEFYYNKNYVNNGSLSSGVLSQNPVYYYEKLKTTSGTLNSYHLSSAPLNYLNTTNGNHITYTEVTEKSNEGYHVYSYTNHDNGYMDKDPFLAIGNPLFSRDISKLELERGRLLGDKIYSKDKFLLQETINEYNDDVNRYNNYVRSIQSTEHNRTPYAIYTFHPYLKKQTVKIYNTQGLNPLVRATDFTYDPNYRLVTDEKLTNSKGAQKAINYLYPFNNSSGTTYPKMVTANMLAYPIQISTVVNTQATYKMINYNEFPTGSGFYYPQNIKNRYSLNGDDVTDIQFDAYDSGNVLQQTKKGIIESFEWGYNKTLPIAKVINAANTLKTTMTSGGNGFSIQFLSASRDAATRQFIVGADGTISLSIDFGGDEGSGTVRAEVTIEINGPNNAGSGPFSLCLATGSASCGNYSSNRVLTGLPPGNYTLTASIYDAQNLIVPVNLSVAYSVSIPVISGSKDFYYDSFEESGGNSAINDCRTGHLSYIGAYNKTLNNLAARSYILSYWKKTGSSWSLQKLSTGPITGGTYTISIPNGQIDDVRFYPVDAQMFTYTYDPLVGMTSSTDPKDETTYYEYDGFQRLMNIREKNQNIIKHIDYHYQGQ
ncbi:hypothetical protein [Mucilaginibacter sp. NFX135]|uniref:hypothetical protein n=1 Tax=Mucilaginibacter sp. NFX135 TaxID=3402687 RepID=UPI003AFA92B2